MITAADLKSRTVKDLAQLAKQMGLSGWHGMRKDQLVQALVRAARKKKAQAARKAAARTTKKTPTLSSARSAKPATARKSNGAAKASNGAAKASNGAAKASNGKAGVRGSSNGSAKNATAKKAAAKPEVEKPKPRTRVGRRVHKANQQREHEKDLSFADTLPKAPAANGRATQKARAAAMKPGLLKKDRIILLVRDSYWLQAIWDITRQTVTRARAAMAEHWHTAEPILRVYEVEAGTTTATAERVLRDIRVHGGVKNWYIDVKEPPGTYRVELGYLASNEKFYSLTRSNTVATPKPGSSDAIDENWSDVAENYEKIYAMSGGYANEQTDTELRELFEERLRRPMGSPVVTKFGGGAEQVLNRHRDFKFDLDAEMIIYGASKPDAHVTLAGEPVKLRPDGTFTVRLSMPDRRQVLPAVASSADGVEQHTIVLAVERNTKVMEPMIRESND